MTPGDESTLPGDLTTSSADSIVAGTVLRDRYVLEEHVAAGASAAVWRGYDRELRRTVAVKMLAVDDRDRDDAQVRFRREAVTAARLSHPGIVAVYDTGTQDVSGTTITWLALEHVDGPTLLTLLRHHPTGLPSTTAAAIVEQAAIALGVAHRLGVVHRDVKPANLLVTTDGVVKIGDFGIALPVGVHIPRVISTPVGTAAYSSPEQLRGDVPADPRMDVFALGVVLFESLTGRAAFPTGGSTNDRDRPLRPRRVRADADRALDAVVARATDPDPAVRFRDAAHLAAELRTLVPVEPRGPAANVVAAIRDDARDDDADDAEERGARSWRERLRWAALVVVVVVAVAAAATILLDAEGASDGQAPIGTDAGTSIRDVRVYDPYGSVDTVPGRLLEVVDGDPATAWSTPAYPRPLRTLGTPGVGVRIDLGEQAAITSLTLEVSPGVTVEVLARDQRPPAGSIELDWELVGRSTDSPATVEIDAGGRTARHWLVWFTDLPSTGETWQASLVDVSFDPVDEQ